MPLVSAEGLVKRFGETVALDGLDLSVEAGTVLGMLGPNGAGKTTAVKILTTLLLPDAGRASIDGIDVTDDPGAVRARIGLTGQFAAVDERLTGRENLDLVGRFFRMSGTAARARATELLGRFRLDQAGGRVVSTYSGGMRRRLDIAMSLVARPVVLFLDEPTTGLDPRSRLDMWDLIEELTAEGMTTLLTTQYLDEADHLSDDIIVIDQGTSIARGTSSELKDRVGGARAVIGFTSTPDVDGLRRALGELATPQGEILVEGREVIVPVRPDATAPVVLRAIDAAGIDIEDLAVERPTLDDVFLTLTGHRAEQTDVDVEEVPA